MLYAAGGLIEDSSTSSSGFLIARDLWFSCKAFITRVIRFKALEKALPAVTAFPYGMLYDVAVVGTVVLVICILKDSV